MGDRYVSSDENKMILYIDDINLYDWAMSAYFRYDETEMWLGHPDLYMKKLEKIINTPDESDNGDFVEVDLRYPCNMKKTTIFPICPEKNFIPKEKYNDYMKKIKGKICTKSKTLICDWTDKIFLNSL